MKTNMTEVATSIQHTWVLQLASGLLAASAWLPDHEGTGCETWVEGWAMGCGQHAMGPWAAAYSYM